MTFILLLLRCLFVSLCVLRLRCSLVRHRKRLRASRSRNLYLSSTIERKSDLGAEDAPLMRHFFQSHSLRMFTLHEKEIIINSLIVK